MRVSGECKGNSEVGKRETEQMRQGRTKGIECNIRMCVVCLKVNRQTFHSYCLSSISFFLFLSIYFCFYIYFSLYFYFFLILSISLLLSISFEAITNIIIIAITNTINRKMPITNATTITTTKKPQPSHLSPPPPHTHTVYALLFIRKTSTRRPPLPLLSVTADRKLKRTPCTFKEETDIEIFQHRKK